MSQIQENQQSFIEDAEPTNRDLLNAINGFATHTEQRFFDIEGDIKHIKDVMVTKQQLKEELGKINGDIGKINGEVGHIKTHMVTKEYLDDKLFDLKGDLVGLVRKEDDKVVMLVEELHTTKVVSTTSAQRILALKPFPQSQR